MSFCINYSQRQPLYADMTEVIEYRQLLYEACQASDLPLDKFFHLWRHLYRHATPLLHSAQGVVELEAPRESLRALSTRVSELMRAKV